MVIKGIIQTIDFNSNSCTVRLPFFENAGNDTEVVTTAIFSTIPGTYNGYKVGDIVFVEFENSDYDQAIVTGKLYLGAKEEGQEGRGAFNIANLTVDGTATIPITTKLSYPGNNETTVDVQNDLSTYKSIEDIARNLQKQETQIGSIYTQIIDDGENLGARVTKLEADDTRHEAEILMNADQISAEVSRASDAEGELSSRIQVNADAIENSVVHVNKYDEIKGMGWHLDTDKWRIYANDNPSGQDPRLLDIVTIDRSGMTVSGDLKIKGYTEDAITLFAQNDSNDEWPATFLIDAETPIPSTIEGYLNHYVEVEMDHKKYYFWIDQKYIDRYNETIEHSDNPYNVQPGTTKRWNLNEYNAENLTGWYQEGSAPEWHDGEFIWRWDRTYRYNYVEPSGGQEGYWVYTYVENIVCITGASGGTGEPAVSYWLNFETPIHTGKNQDTDIIVTAFRKIGTGVIESEHEQYDPEAYLRYYWDGDTPPAWPNNPNTQITIQAIDLTSGIHLFEDKNLIIEATHNPNETPVVKIYDKETVTYAPLDKPVLDLSNDNASIVYYGDQKLGNNVSSTAQVYLGTNTEAATYAWSVNGCHAKNNVLNNATIEIDRLDANNATATVVATCTNLLDENGNHIQLQKVFTITKQLKGEQGEQGPAGESTYTISVENDFDSIPADANGNISGYDWQNKTKHYIRLYYGATLQDFSIVEENDPDHPIPSSGLCIVYTRTNVTLGNTPSVSSQVATAWISSLTDDTGGILYTIYKNGASTGITAEFSAVKIKSPTPIYTVSIDNDFATIPTSMVDVKIFRDDTYIFKPDLKGYIRDQIIVPGGRRELPGMKLSTVLDSQHEALQIALYQPPFEPKPTTRANPATGESYVKDLSTHHVVVYKDGNIETITNDNFIVKLDDDGTSISYPMDENNNYLVCELSGFDINGTYQGNDFPGMNPSVTNNTVTNYITALSTLNSSSRNINANYTYYVKGVAVATAKFELTRHSGPITYFIESTATGIKIDKNDSPNPISITFTSKQYSTNTGEITTYANYWRYWWDDNSSSPITSGPANTLTIYNSSSTFANHSKLTVELHSDLDRTQLWDRETIDIIKDGKDAVDYEINTDIATIKKDETTSITFNFYKTTGIGGPSAFSDGRYRYRIDSTSEQDWSSWVNSQDHLTIDTNTTPAISSITQSIEVELQANFGTTAEPNWLKVDSEKVLVMEDGSQGIGIKSLTTYYALVDADVTHIQKPDYIPTGETTPNYHIYGSLDDGSTIIDLTTNIPQKGYGWDTNPPTYKDNWVYYTSILTIYSDDDQTVSPAITHREFSNPVRDNGLDGVYTVAQGKSTNYYGPNDPASTPEGQAKLKKGDGWFDTAYHQLTKPSTKTDYIKKYILDPDLEPGEDLRYILITSQNLNEYIIGNDPNNWPDAYSGPTLYEWSADGSSGEWKDVGGELITNKVTATYINALDITANKIKVIDPDPDDSSDDILFYANGEDHEVSIAGWNVETTKIEKAGYKQETHGEEEERVPVYTKLGIKDEKVYVPWEATGDTNPDWSDITDSANAFNDTYEVFTLNDGINSGTPYNEINGNGTLIWTNLITEDEDSEDIPEELMPDGYTFVHSIPNSSMPHIYVDTWGIGDDDWDNNNRSIEGSFDIFFEKNVVEDLLAIGAGTLMAEVNLWVTQENIQGGVILKTTGWIYLDDPDYTHEYSGNNQLIYTSCQWSSDYTEWPPEIIYIDGGGYQPDSNIIETVEVDSFDVYYEELYGVKASYRAENKGDANFRDHWIERTNKNGHWEWRAPTTAGAAGDGMKYHKEAQYSYEPNGDVLDMFEITYQPTITGSYIKKSKCPQVAYRFRQFVQNINSDTYDNIKHYDSIDDITVDGDYWDFRSAGGYTPDPEGQPSPSNPYNLIVTEKNYKFYSTPTYGNSLLILWGENHTNYANDPILETDDTAFTQWAEGQTTTGRIKPDIYAIGNLSLEGSTPQVNKGHLFETLEDAIDWAQHGNAGGPQPWYPDLYSEELFSASETQAGGTYLVTNAIETGTYDPNIYYLMKIGASTNVYQATDHYIKETTGRYGESTIIVSNPEAPNETILVGANDPDLGSIALMKIKFKKNAYNFSFYIRTSSEAENDFIIVSKLLSTDNDAAEYIDDLLTGRLLYKDVLGSTQYLSVMDNSVIDDYKKITLPVVNKDDFIYIFYKKNRQNSWEGDDTGYILLPKNKNKQITAFAAGPTKQEFAVTTDGKLLALNASINGTITSTKGELGGWKIGQDGIASYSSQASILSSGTILLKGKADEENTAGGLIVFGPSSVEKKLTIGYTDKSNFIHNNGKLEIVDSYQNMLFRQYSDNTGAPSDVLKYRSNNSSTNGLVLAKAATTTNKTISVEFKFVRGRVKGIRGYSYALHYRYKTNYRFTSDQIVKLTLFYKWSDFFGLVTQQNQIDFNVTIPGSAVEEEPVTGNWTTIPAKDLPALKTGFWITPLGILKKGDTGDPCSIVTYIKTVTATDTATPSYSLFTVGSLLPLADDTGYRIQAVNELSKNNEYDSTTKSTRNMRYYLSKKNPEHDSDPTAPEYIRSEVNLGSPTSTWHTLYAKKINGDPIITSTGDTNIKIAYGTATVSSTLNTIAQFDKEILCATASYKGLSGTTQRPVSLNWWASTTEEGIWELKATGQSGTIAYIVILKA